MKLLAKQNRELIMINAQNTQNENDAEKIVLKVPEQYEDFNKKIVFVTPDGNVWDIITNNEYLIPKAITKYKQVDFYIWLTQGNVDFRSQTKTLKFYHNVDASGEITPEEISGVNTVVNLLEEEIEKVNNLETEIDGKLEEVDTAIDNIHTAIQETENLDLDAEKVGQTTTITLTKKDGTVKTVHVDDGVDLQFMWQGTSLGIKTAEQEEYTFVDLQGVQGQRGEQGEPFTIKKTYSSVAEMNADFNNMQLGDYVMIASTVEVEDNAKLYTRGENQWIFITDFSGATGIRGEVGLTPNVQIGTVTQGSSFNVTRTGTNENPVLNFTLVKGDKGDRGIQGIQGLTGNGIASITKTGTDGLVDTYTITYTNGNTTTFTITNGEDGEVTETELDVLRQNDTELKNDISTNADEITNLKNENSYLQNVVKQAFTETSASGTELTINNTIEARMEMKLNGNTSQNGEPTPATPQDIEVVTGNNKIIVSGKNLLPPNNNTSTTINGVTFTRNSDGSVLVNGTATANATYVTSRNFMLEDGKTYILSGCPNGGSTSTYMLNIDQYYNKTSHILNNTGYDREFTYVLDSKNSNSIFIYVVSGTKCDNLLFKPMVSINGGDYEPYVGRQDFPINLGSIELCKIDNYQDYIYKNNGKWYKHKVIDKIVLNGDMNWIFFDKGKEIGIKSNSVIQISNALIPVTDSTQNETPLFSSHFVKGTQTIVIKGYNFIGFSKWGNDIYLYLPNDYDSIDTAKKWLNTNKPIVYYAISTPTEEEITDTTLITQLDEISQALSKKGTTIISQNNDDLPFNLDVIALTK